jgi:hypothetical protein
VAGRRRSWLAWVAGSALALVAAALVAGLGPEHTVVCGRGSLLDRVAQALTQPLGAGHVDGPSASWCTVPTAGAWLLAVLAALAILEVTFLVARRRRGGSGGPGSDERSLSSARAEP